MEKARPIFRVKCFIIFHLSKVSIPPAALYTPANTRSSVPTLSSRAALAARAICGTRVASAGSVVFSTFRARFSLENNVANALCLLWNPGLNPVVLASLPCSDDFGCVSRDIWLWLNGWVSVATSSTGLLIAALVFEVELVAVGAIDWDTLLLATRPEPIFDAFAGAQLIVPLLVSSAIDGPALSPFLAPLFFIITIDKFTIGFCLVEIMSGEADTLTLGS